VKALIDLELKDSGVEQLVMLFINAAFFNSQQCTYKILAYLYLLKIFLYSSNLKLPLPIPCLCSLQVIKVYNDQIIFLHKSKLQ